MATETKDEGKTKEPRHGVAFETIQEEISKVEGLETTTQAGFHKVRAPGRLGALYVARSLKVGRVDISGFDMQHPGVRSLTQEEAREHGLGKVRGQIDFTDEVQALRALRTALKLLKRQPMVPVKEPKALTADKGGTRKRKSA